MWWWLLLLLLLLLARRSQRLVGRVARCVRRRHRRLHGTRNFVRHAGKTAQRRVGKCRLPRWWHINLDLLAWSSTRWAGDGEYLPIDADTKQLPGRKTCRHDDHNPTVWHWLLLPPVLLLLLLPLLRGPHQAAP